MTSEIAMQQRYLVKLRATRAKPELAAAPVHFRVRVDKVDSSGRVMLRYLSVLRHIYVGRRHSGQAIRLLVADDRVRIVSERGELLGEVTLDAERRSFGASGVVHIVVRQVSGIS